MRREMQGGWGSGTAVGNTGRFLTPGQESRGDKGRNWHEALLKTIAYTGKTIEGSLRRGVACV